MVQVQEEARKRDCESGLVFVLFDQTTDLFEISDWHPRSSFSNNLDNVEQLKQFFFFWLTRSFSVGGFNRFDGFWHPACVGMCWIGKIVVPLGTLTLNMKRYHGESFGGIE